MSDGATNDEYMDAEESLSEDLEQRSEEEKMQGNVAYKAKDYYTAIKHYTNAINILPDKAAYYGNRSAAYVMINNYSKALEDATRAVSLEPTFIKASIRMLKCHIAMGNITAASRLLEELKTRDSNNSSSYATERTNINRLREYQNNANETMNKGDFRKVVYVMDRALEIAPACIQFKVQRAECLVCLGRYTEADQAANDILRNNNFCSGALYVKGLSLFYQDNIEKARKFFIQVLRVDPDHNKAKIANKRAKDLEQTKQKGNTAFTTGKHEEALKLYKEALMIDPNNRITNAKLHCNIAAVRMKLHQWDDAVQACNSAIRLDENYTKAYIRRAACYQELDRHDEAVRDCEKIHNMEHSRESKQRLRDANFKLKLSKRKDYYKILNVSKNASEDEIKKGYKKAALKFHPDRHSSGTDEEKAAAEVKFKEAGEAYSVLSDNNKRRRYDNGEDLDDPMGGMNIDPTQIFETMFGGFHGGPGFSHGRPGGGHAFTFSFG